MLKAIVSAPGLAFASKMACWNDPGPLLAVVVTIMVSPHPGRTKPPAIMTGNSLHSQNRVDENFSDPWIDSIFNDIMFNKIFSTLKAMRNAAESQEGSCTDSDLLDPKS